MVEYIKDVIWKNGQKVSDFLEQMKANGYQSIELYKAAEIIYKMKKEKAKIFLTFTSNLGTSGLRGLFAQLIKLGLADIIVTTAGALEEDIMKSIGEKFLITRFNADDIALHEKGHNRVGNIAITTDTYQKFEGFIIPILEKIAKEKKSLTTSELIYEIGKNLKDNNSFIRQAYLKKVPIHCPSIIDGSIGFQLYFVKQKHPEFNIDIISDFKETMFYTTQDDRKGVIALGGGVSKHFAILSSLISGGMDYAVYITTANATSGSASGATTSEAKSWGKIKDDADSVTVKGDATVLFPLVMFSVLDRLKKEGEI
ncbi:MAG: deoxyhypusine synthase family protein [Candidatus ainarchaeum sp.]|nr:deoxyhypusine synthase family protein [Candidatus ainarchaeum sp.]